MAKTVLIGCKLPHGLIITSPLNPNHKVKILGLRDSKIIGATFIVTPVDEEFWEIWKSSYMDFQPLKSGAIFEARTQDEADGKGKDLTTVKTGLERLSPTAHGVKPASKD